MNGKDSSTSPGRRARTAGPGGLRLQEGDSGHAAPNPMQWLTLCQGPPTPSQTKGNGGTPTRPKSVEGPQLPGQGQRRAPTLNWPRSVSLPTARPRALEGSPHQPKASGGPPNQAEGSGWPPAPKQCGPETDLRTYPVTAVTDPRRRNTPPGAFPAAVQKLAFQGEPASSVLGRWPLSADPHCGVLCVGLCCLCCENLDCEPGGVCYTGEESRCPHDWGSQEDTSLP